MEPFEYTPSTNNNELDYSQTIQDLELQQRSDGFLWTNEYSHKLMDTIQKMSTEINSFRSSNGFKNSNVEDEIESYYSAPNYVDQQMFAENENLKSQISELESDIHTNPDFERYFDAKMPSFQDNMSVKSMPVGDISDH